MIVNGKALLAAAPIIGMVSSKQAAIPTSWGLTECGYDIRLKQRVIFNPKQNINAVIETFPSGDTYSACGTGNFVLGSSIEEFDVPNHLMGRVLNKSTWARKGLDASMTTNIEPGWKGFLTIELVYHGQEPLIIPEGAGICQVIFETLQEPSTYSGKYQNQADRPVEGIIV